MEPNFNLDMFTGDFQMHEPRSNTNKYKAFLERQFNDTNIVIDELTKVQTDIVNTLYNPVSNAVAIPLLDWQVKDRIIRRLTELEGLEHKLYESGLINVDSINHQQNMLLKDSHATMLSYIDIVNNDSTVNKVRLEEKANMLQKEAHDLMETFNSIEVSFDNDISNNNKDDSNQMDANTFELTLKVE